MKKYVVSVMDFESGEIDLVVEGIYKNLCLAFNSMWKVLEELLENAKYNGKTKIKVEYKFDNKYKVENIIIKSGDEALYQINLSETFE